MSDARKLPLPCGHFALIDAEDWERVSQFKWRTWTRRSAPDRVYVYRTVRLPPDSRWGSVALHRFILGAQPGEVVDHRNGDPLDNRKANLRITDARGNATNVTSSKMQKLGGYKGVTWHKKGKKWQACIGAGEVKANGKRRLIYLGLFTDPVAAAKAYDAAARHYFGEYAATNFPPEPVEFVQSAPANASEKESA